jgi:hypothetical protein
LVRSLRGGFAEQGLDHSLLDRVRFALMNFTVVLDFDRAACHADQ